MRNYVIINGVNSLTIKGLAINELPPIIKPQMRSLREEIDGRDGDIITELGYSAYDKEMTIGLYDGYDIDEIIAFFNGEGTIVFSNESDKYYNFKILEQIDYEALIKYRTALVTLHCQPFKYPLEETPLIIEPTIDTLENVTSARIETNENTLSTTLKGNTSQDTTTGKNIFHIENVTPVASYITYDKISENKIIVKNTNTGVTFKYATISSIEVEANTTYYFKAKVTNTNSSIQSNWLTIPSLFNASYTSGETKSFNTGTNTSIEIQLYTNGNTTGANEATWENIQLTKTSGDTYEPYTGGNPAPNPSYPQPINVVTGDNNIVICGKNLFDKTTITIGSYLKEDGTLQTGLGTEYVTSDFIPTTPNTAYYKTATGSPRTKFYDKNKQPLNTTTYQDISIGSSAGTFTTPNNAYYLRITIYTTNASLDTIMVHKGSTALPYEPYTSQNYPVYLGVDNLLKYPYRDTTKTENGITFTDMGDGTIKVNGTASANAYFYLTTTNDDTYKKYNGMKLTISGCPSGGNTNTYQIGFYNDNFSTGTSDYGNGGTFTGGDVRYNQSYIRISSGVQCDNLIFKPQLELGTKKNSYTPYGTTPIELCKIGDYQDELLKSTGKNIYTNEIEYNNSVIASNGAINSATGFIVSNPISIDISKDIYVSFVAGSLNDKTMRVGYYDSENNFISRPIFDTTPTKLTPPSNAQYLRLSYDARNLTAVQIEYNQATSYEPYGIVWYIKEQIGKVVLDGSESTWWKSNTYQGSFYLASNNTKLNGKVIPFSELYCNYFIRANITNSSQVSSNYTQGTCFIENIQGSIDFWYDDGTTTLADFKTWLETHNIIIYFPLATPNYRVITDTNLISQLEALKGATTYYGITNINQQNNDLPFIMDLSYMVKDTDEVIVDNIGNIYSKPTIALEGNGTGGIYLNDNQILSVELTDKMTISISDMEAFDPDTHALLNRDVTGNYNSMTLQPSNNTIKITGGITKATITDYTRWL